VAKVETILIKIMEIFLLLFNFHLKMEIIPSLNSMLDLKNISKRIIICGIIYFTLLIYSKKNQLN